jgi:hypothetical protein
MPLSLKSKPTLPISFLLTNVKAAGDKRGPVDDDVSDRQAVREVALLVVVGAQLLRGGLDHLELLVNYESVFS